MKRFIFYSPALLIYFFINNTISAQSNNEVGFQTWTDVTLIYDFNKKLQYSGDMGTRGIISPKDWNIFYVRPILRWKLHPAFDLRSGLSMFYIQNNATNNVTQVRFHQESNLKWPQFAGFGINHRVRFEEILFIYENSGKDFSSRVRYNLFFNTPDFAFTDKGSSIYFYINVEIFVPLKKVFEEFLVKNDRLCLGYGHKLTDRFNYELQYFLQRSRDTATEPLNINDHTIRLRFFYLINQLL